MKKRNLYFGAVLAIFMTSVVMSQNSWGTPNGDSALVSQTFTVENMTCATCPITVRKAMSRVTGVQKVNINYEAKTVTATYDPTKADTATIAEASTAVGFPAHATGEAL